MVELHSRNKRYENTNCPMSFSLSLVATIERMNVPDEEVRPELRGMRDLISERTKALVKELEEKYPGYRLRVSHHPWNLFPAGPDFNCTLDDD